MIRNEIFMGTDRSVKGLCRSTLVLIPLITENQIETDMEHGMGTGLLGVRGGFKILKSMGGTPHQYYYAWNLGT